MSFHLKRFVAIISALILFGALFPWAFMFQGRVLGVSISLRALGDISGVGLIILGLIYFFSKNAQSRLLELARDLDASNSTMRARVLWGFTALYFILMVSHKLRSHSLLSTHAYDLGFFSNICWNTAHGNWFFSSELERNFMGMHVNWILWPLSFFYRLGGDARVLLIAQAAFVSASIPLLWKLVKNITTSFSAGMLGSLLFVCSPYINHSVSNDFHPDLWLLPCLMGSILSWRQNKPVTTVFLALLAILAKEDVSVVVCAWGMLLIFKKWKGTGAILFAASLAIFLFHTQIFTPKFLGESQKSLLFYRYAFLSETATAPSIPLLFLKAIVSSTWQIYSTGGLSAAGGRAGLFRAGFSVPSFY